MIGLQPFLAGISGANPKRSTAHKEALWHLLLIPNVQMSSAF